MATKKLQTNRQKPRKYCRASLFSITNSSRSNRYKVERMMAVIRKNVEMKNLPKFGNSTDDDIVEFIQKFSLSLNIYHLIFKPNQGTFTCFVRMCLYLLSFAFKGFFKSIMFGTWFVAKRVFTCFYSSSEDFPPSSTMPGGHF